MLPVRGGGQTISNSSRVNLRSQDDFNVPHRVLLETTASVNFFYWKDARCRNAPRRGRAQG